MHLCLIGKSRQGRPPTSLRDSLVVDLVVEPVVVNPGRWKGKEGHQRVSIRLVGGGRAGGATVVVGKRWKATNESL